MVRKHSCNSLQIGCFIQNVIFILILGFFMMTKRSASWFFSSFSECAWLRRRKNLCCKISENIPRKSIKVWKPVRLKWYFQAMKWWILKIHKVFCVEISLLLSCLLSRWIPIFSSNANWTNFNCFFIDLFSLFILLL